MLGAAMPRRPRKTQVTRFAIDDLEVVVVDVEQARAWDERWELTAAEREVARMAVEGCSDTEIAARRGTSRSTVANQLGRIYRKLSVASRAELAALALRDSAVAPEAEAPEAEQRAPTR
jgi:DNA-binding CsgD family transcriptional regulator